MAKKLTDTTSFWVIIIIFVFLVLIGLGFYWFKVLTDDSYYNYQGKGGEYKIGKSKVGTVIFYDITVLYDNINYIYFFRNHPQDLEDVYLEGNLFDALNRPGGTRRIYVTKDFELANITDRDSILAADSFKQMLIGQAAIYNMDVVDVYTTEVREDLPVIDCRNVTNEIAVIYLELGDETKVYSEDGCVIIQGRGGNGIIRAGEKFAYSLLGVF